MLSICAYVTGDGIFTPKAFSMRSAMLPERLALPLSKLERVGRET
jgi:hypothetical protein